MIKLIIKCMVWYVSLNLQRKVGNNMHICIPENTINPSKTDKSKSDIYALNEESRIKLALQLLLLEMVLFHFSFITFPGIDAVPHF